MSRIFSVITFLFLLHGSAVSATKAHNITFGKWTTVKWRAGHEQNQPVDLKVRPLFVDGRLKEYTIGLPHDITERLFVVRKAFRQNDALPGDKEPSRWLWERGGWLLIDRVAAHISSINLSDYDTYYSVASWFRDYVAYCGVSDDGEKLYLIVAQLGRRRLVLRKPAGKASDVDEPDSACIAPSWQRQPTRVSFVTNSDEKTTYEVRGHAVDLIKEEDDAEAGTE